MKKPRPIQLIIVLLYGMSFTLAQGQKTDILIVTEVGEIHVRLFERKAPATTANFLRYVDAGLFDSSCFYRVVRMDNQPRDSIRIEVIQGGRYDKEEDGFAPVRHETTKATGIHHRNGTISMARMKPGSATSEFFICIGNQPELDFGGRRNPDGQGFAAFGKVISGMDVVKKIHMQEAKGQYLDKKTVISEIIRTEK